MMHLDILFQKLAQLKVGIIGDIMLDSYIWGSVERISPEAPVPIVALKKMDYRLGGAANVALNTVSLGASTTIIALVGADKDGTILKKILTVENINTDYIYTSTQRITTNKTRIIARNQQMLRLDAESLEYVNETEENNLLHHIENYIQTENPDILILEDYNKGVLSDTLIKKTIALAKRNNVLIAVDPKKKNFFSYHEVDIFKPNLKEAIEALHLSAINIAEDKDLKKIHSLLKEKLQHNMSLITLSEHGLFYNESDSYFRLPAHLRKIADVSGAGDTVIALVSLVYAATGDIHLASEIANIGGGLVCEQVGTVAINKEKLLEECKLLLPAVSN